MTDGTVAHPRSEVEATDPMDDGWELRRGEAARVGPAGPPGLDDDAERRFRSLIDSVDVIVWEAEAEPLRFTFVSRRAEDILGFPVRRWIDEPDFWTNLVHPDDRERAAATLRDAAREGGNRVVEYRALASDGRTVSLRNLVHAEDGQPASGGRLRGVMVDVTEPKRGARRQEALFAVTRVLAETVTLDEASPKILRAICESLGWELGQLWRVDEAANTLRCVEAWHGTPGGFDEFLSVSKQTAFPPGIGLPGRVWASRKPAWITDVADDTNFPRMPIAVKEGLHAGFGFPILYRGRVLGVMEFFSREVRESDDETQTVMAAVGVQMGQLLARRQADDARRENDAQAKAVLESAIDCVISMDGTGRIVEFNPAAERTFGYARSDVIGRPLADLIIPASLREQHTVGLARYHATGEGSLLGRRVEITAMRADGSEFPVELAIVEVDLPGQAMFTGYIRDITDRKRTETALRESRERSEFLAEAGAILASSLDYPTTLAALARLAVPYLGDWCLVDVIEDGGSIRRVAVAHVDPGKAGLAETIGAAPHYRWDPDAATGVPMVLRTGRPAIVSEITDEQIEAVRADSAFIETLKAVGPRSYMCVPLAARGRTLGAITFVSAESLRSYGQSDLSLAEELAWRAALAVDNARLFHERARVARTLQQSLLPPSLPEIPGVELAARYRPADGDVGGDFYDVFRTGGRGWAIVLGDVCGKGADAAAITAIARYTIRAAAMQARKPRRILALLNEALLRQRPDERSGERFCTVAYARVARVENGARVSVACAGHPSPLVLRRNGSVETACPTGGTALGLFPNPELADGGAELAAGEALLMFTDGVIEARGPSGETFGDERLRALLASCAGLGAEAIAGRIEDELDRFQAEASRDDVALLVIRVPA